MPQAHEPGAEAEVDWGEAAGAPTKVHPFVMRVWHSGADSRFTRAGKEGAHEKGGVEGEVGRFRRNHLVPVPEVADLAELNGAERSERRERRRLIEARFPVMKSLEELSFAENPKIPQATIAAPDSRTSRDRASHRRRVTPRLPAVTPRQAVRALERCGWKLDRVKGSHHVFRHPRSLPPGRRPDAQS